MIMKSGVISTSEAFMSRLQRALAQHGDFPASAKVVTEMRELTQSENTSAAQVAEVILREPSLGPRILHLVNSAFYLRAKPIMTISQAVIQVGMKPISELCSNLVLLQKLIPAARRGGALATCLQRSITTALLAGVLGGADLEDGKPDEASYLAGSFSELGLLLLAFYFPQVLENAAKRSEQKNQSFDQSIQEITGHGPRGISATVVESLELPMVYLDIIARIMNPNHELRVTTPQDQVLVARLTPIIRAASELTSAIFSSGTKTGVDSVIRTVMTQTLDERHIVTCLGKLHDLFNSHCQILDVQLPALPDFLKLYRINDGETVILETAEMASQTSRLSQFTDEIRSSVKSGEPITSILTSTMETIIFELGFERALLMLATQDKISLAGRMIVGQNDGLQPRTITCALHSSETNPAATCFKKGQLVSAGIPLLQDGWPFAIIPVGLGTRTIGVIYADRISGSGELLSTKDQAALNVLIDILDEAVREGR